MSDEEPRFVEVPRADLDAVTLRRLVEAFVTREGTDYGRLEKSLDDKVADVMRQLDRDEAKIVFDPDSESINIVSSRDV